MQIAFVVTVENLSSKAVTLNLADRIRFAKMARLFG